MTDSNVSLEDLLSSLMNDKGGSAEETGGYSGAGEEQTAPSDCEETAGSLKQQLTEEKAFSAEKIAELEKTSRELAAARRDNEGLNSRLSFIAEAVEAEPEQNSGLEQFRRLLDEDYQRYANGNSSHAAGAMAMRKLMDVQARLALVSRDRDITGKCIAAVGGAFSSGKSSFMNSLFLHDRITLPVGMDQTTAIASYVLNGETTEITASTYRGGKVAVPDRIFPLFTYRKKDELMFNMKRIISDIVFRTEFIRAYDNICFVDTPGFNPGSCSELDYSTAVSAISGAQVLLWCFDVSGGTIHQDDMNILQDILDANPDIRIYVIANRADLKSQEENAEILGEAETLLKDSGIPFWGMCLYTSRKKFGSQPEEYTSSSRGKRLADFLEENNRPDTRKLDGLISQVRSVFDGYKDADDRQMNDARNRIQAINSIEGRFFDVIGKKDEAISDYKSRAGRKAMSGSSGAYAPDSSEEGIDAVSGGIAEIRKDLESVLQKARVDKAAAEELCLRFERCIRSIFSGSAAEGCGDDEAARHLDAEQQYRLGERFYNGDGAERDFTEAFGWYLKSAARGNSSAQLRLGQMYRIGTGTPENGEESEKWYLKSAGQGNADAMYELGNIYAWEGVKSQLRWDSDAHDEFERKAVSWYGKAYGVFSRQAEHGDAHALKMLGEIYSSGNGADKDESRAFESYAKAAGYGDADAQNVLGNMYFSGKGAGKDFGRALEWYQKSAEQGNACAMCSLGNMYRNGLAVRQDCGEAVKWYAKSADLGNLAAMKILGCMYRDGSGVFQDPAEAAKWFCRSAENGDIESQYIIGGMYLNGTGVSQDSGEALKWYLKAAEKDSADAQFSLAEMYRNGTGVGQDLSEARKWLRKSAGNGNKKAGAILSGLDREAAEHGDAEAQYQLAEKYSDESGMSADYRLEPNKAEAVRWCRMAAEQGHPAAQYKLAGMYASGEDGVEKDDDESEKWYLKAAEQGYADAQRALGLNYRLKSMSAFFSGSSDGKAPSDKDHVFYEHEFEKWTQKALTTYRKQAAGGDTYAMCRLGDMYKTGLEVEEDRRQAEKWYRMAADHGSWDGRMRLAMLREEDEGKRRK